MKNIHFTPLAAGDFFQNAELFQIGNQFISRSRRNVRHFSNLGGINHRSLIQILDNLLGVGRSAAKNLDLGLHFFLQFEDIVKGGDAAFRGFDNIYKKNVLA